MGAGGLLPGLVGEGFCVCGRAKNPPWDLPKLRVVGGPYRLVRNPMYLVVLGLVGGGPWNSARWR